MGTIIGVHGVRGLVKIRSETAFPGDCAAYGPVTDLPGTRSFDLRVTGMAKGAVLAELVGVTDRDVAMALKGMRLYVPRDALPEAEEDEFYHADLIGLAVELSNGTPYGHVKAMHDFGAGELMEVQPLPQQKKQAGSRRRSPPRRNSAGKAAMQDKARTVVPQSVMLPFTREVVPDIDLKSGRIVVSLPAGLTGGESAEDKALWQEVLQEQGAEDELSAPRDSEDDQDADVGGEETIP